MRYDCFPFVRKRLGAPWDLLGIISQLSRQPRPSEGHVQCAVMVLEGSGAPPPTFVWHFFKLWFNSYKTCHRSHFKLYNVAASNTFTELCNHHYYLVRKRFHHPKRNPLLNKQSSPIPSHWQPLVCFLCPYIYLLGVFVSLGSSLMWPLCLTSITR